MGIQTCLVAFRNSIIFPLGFGYNLFKSCVSIG